MAKKTNAAVPAFIADLDHPLKATVVALRKLLLSIDPAISEEIKWNAPSFRTSEHFATMHLRSKDAVQLILHLGAKSKQKIGPKDVADSAGLLKWLGPDRASVSFSGAADLAGKSEPLVAIIRHWITHV